MSQESNTTEDFEHPMKACTNDDLVSEVKTRIETGALKETLLFDGNTGRIYSDLGKEDRRCLRPNDILRLVFPFQNFNPDSVMHQQVAECLFDLPDEDFRALKSTVAAETEESMQRLIARLEDIGAEMRSDEPENGDLSDD